MRPRVFYAVLEEAEGASCLLSDWVILLLSVLTAQPGSLHTVYKLPKDKVLISAEFLSSFGGSEQKRKSQAISCEESNPRTGMLLCTVFRLGARWRGEGYTIFLAVGQKKKKKAPEV